MGETKAFGLNIIVKIHYGTEQVLRTRSNGC